MEVADRKASAKSSSETPARHILSFLEKLLTFRSADDEDEDYQTQFEAELAMMDNEEFDTDVIMGDGPEHLRTSHVKWARPDLPPIDPKKDAVVFQQVDIDHYVGQPMVGMPGAQVRRSADECFVQLQAFCF